MNYEEDLRDLSRRAARAAAEIDTGGRPTDQFQTEVANNIPACGPDPCLQNVQLALANVALAIDAYLSRGNQ